MANILYEYTSPQQRKMTITDEYTVYDDQLYINDSGWDFELSGFVSGSNVYGSTSTIELAPSQLHLANGGSPNLNYDRHLALYFYQETDGVGTRLQLQILEPNNPSQINAIEWYSTYRMIPAGTCFYNARVDYAPSSQCEISTNIPIFDTYEKAVAYVQAVSESARIVALREALNYKSPEVSPDGSDFTISNMWTYGIWLNDTQPQVTQVYHRDFRAKMTDGTFALYPISGIDDNKLKMGIKNNATFYEMQYSTDGQTWVDTDEFPFDFFYRKRVNELSPTPDTYLGYALTFSNSKIPVFKDEETAQGYIDGEVDITDADNWREISGSYPIINNTAESDDDTTMGTVYTKSFFSQQYICSESAIQQISNALFDIDSGGLTGLWDDIKRGLEMYGNNPMDAVQGCMFFPINLSSVFTNTQNQTYIYFGGYQFNLTGGVSVDKILYPNGSYDFGSFDLYPSFGGSWRDFSPYQRLFVFLPYIGWCELDIARYLGKHINVKYYFDTRTGMCMACLFTQTSTGYCIVDYFQGQCGVSMPITLSDYTSFMNAQIQTLLGGNQRSTYDGGLVGDFAKGVGTGLVESGAMSVGTMALGGLAGGAMLGATKTLYGLTQNNINNFNKTKGGSSGMLNQYLPQEVCFLLETQDADVTPNELSLMGYPSNASGRLCDFSGYLEVDTVNLVCPYATENEKAEIVQMLKSGVYI